MAIFIAVLLAVGTIIFLSYPLVMKGFGASGPGERRPSPARRGDDTEDEIEKEVKALRRSQHKACKKCGASYGDGDRFCAKCGANLGERRID